MAEYLLTSQWCSDLLRRSYQTYQGNPTSLAFQASIFLFSIHSCIIFWPIKKKQNKTKQKTGCHSGLLGKYYKVYYSCDVLFKVVHHKGKFSSLFNLTNLYLLKRIFKCKPQDFSLICAKFAPNATCWR